MRPAGWLVTVLGLATLLGALLFSFLREDSRRGASARPVPAAPTADETRASAPELDASRSPREEVSLVPPAAPGSSDEEPPAAKAPADTPPPAAPADTALLFRVVDARTGQPLTTFEARVGQAFLRPLLDDQGRIRHDFPDGRARFPGLIEGREGASVQLAILARGYREQRVPELFVAPGRELDLGTLRLERAPRLGVRVLDERTGAPVPGAVVSLLAAGIAPVPGSSPPVSSALDPWSGRTDRDGRVLLTSRPGERAFLTVRHDAHAPLDVELDLPPAEEHEETVRLAAR